jgi:hypothetical protein
MRQRIAVAGSELTTKQRASVETFLRPSMALLVKLGSIAIHCDEMLSSEGHNFDRLAIESILNDKEVRDFIEEGQRTQMLPMKR